MRDRSVDWAWRVQREADTSLVWCVDLASSGGGSEVVASRLISDEERWLVAHWLGLRCGSNRQLGWLLGYWWWVDSRCRGGR